MGISEAPVWLCDVCGFRWLKAGDVEPTHCASGKCRSRLWNAGPKLEDAEVAHRTIRSTTGVPGRRAQRVVSPAKLERRVRAEKNRETVKAAVAGLAGVSDNFTRLAEGLAAPRGRCPHDYMNRLQCPKCNPEGAK